MENICLRISILNPRGKLEYSVPVGAVLDAWPLDKFATYNSETNLVIMKRENRGTSGLLFIIGCPDGFLEFAKNELRQPLIKKSEGWTVEEPNLDMIRPNKWYADTSLVSAEEIVTIQQSKFLKISFEQAKTVLIEKEPVDDDVRNDIPKHTLGASGKWLS